MHCCANNNAKVAQVVEQQDSCTKGSEFKPTCSHPYFFFYQKLYQMIKLRLLDLCGLVAALLVEQA